MSTSALSCRLLAVLTAATLLLPLSGTANAQNGLANGREGENLGWAVEGTNATLAHVAEVTGANHLQNKGLTGAGIGVALIDTGVAPVTGVQDVWHGPDLSLDSQIPEAYQLDAYGHGTHLAGIITSDRADARGIAPGARLISVKAGAHNGAVDVTQVLAAIDWVVQHKAEHNIRVMVLAYGTDSAQSPQIDPLAHAVEVAWRNGIVVVVAAGNEGELRPRLVNPALNPYVISVAAIDSQGTKTVNDDTRPAFSALGDEVRRPDIAAPGVGIVSLRVPGGYLDEHYADARQGDALFRGNGTSQAAAVVGAGAALLLQGRPWLTPDQVKQILISSADKTNAGTTGIGGGVINLLHASNTNPWAFTQTWAPSTGTGSLEAARGSFHVVGDGVELAGEIDIHGQPFDSATWAAQATGLRSWDGGVWNGTQWTGSGWTGQSWNGWGWGGWGWGGWGWGGWGWGGAEWNGWGWGGWGWGGWGWGGWGWGGWGWGGAQWD